MTTPFPPRALAAITDPASVNCHPAVLQGAWITLKAARRQTVHIERLAVTAHLIGPEKSSGVTEIGHHRANAIARLKAGFAANRTRPYGGDAA